jgi:hypothetical protein
MFDIAYERMYSNSQKNRSPLGEPLWLRQERILDPLNLI